ncbi:MAG: efflux RND transporter permease subunit, partial [Candidatus Omnitrophica bacterium]|nr:efflux RND transporter permease subunit [Candidatus Omnitrophota bacterium]
MNIVKLAIKRPILILVFFLIIILLGLFSFPRLKIDLVPKVDIPIVTVMTVYPGAGPQQVELLVTKPIEDAISTTNNLKNIRSSSIEGVSIVIAQFKMGSSIDIAVTDVREKISSILGTLPDDAKQPEILKVDINAQPVLYLSVSGSDLKKVYNLVENFIKIKIQTVAGVGKIDLIGGEKREIRVVSQPDKLVYYGLDLTALAQRLKLENINIPSGHYIIADREVSGRLNTEFITPEEIKSINIPILDMSIGQVRTVPLSAIAQVYDTVAEQRDKVRTNQKESVGITIQKQPDANTIEVAENVKKILPEIQKQLPEDISIKVVADTSEFIRSAVEDVWHKLYISIILTGLVLFAFLYSVGSTLIVCIAIPVSLTGALFLSYISGFTLNIMTLTSLTFSIGIVVDSSIVIIENIFRHRKELKQEPAIAAEKGTAEVASAVTATMITHMVVFLPIVFLSGLIGQFFKEFGMVQIYTTILAICVAFTLTPMLATKFLKDTEEKTWAGNAERKFDTFRNAYRSALTKFLKKPKAVLIIVVVLIPLSFLLVPLIGFEMVTNADEGMYTISLTMPPGTSLQKTESVVKKIEEGIITREETETVFSSIGKTIGAFAGVGSQGPEYAQMQVKLKEKRNKSTEQVIEEIKPVLAEIPGTVTVAPQRSIGGSGSRPPLEFYVTGTDEKQVIQVSRQILDIMKTVPGISDSDSSFKPGKPEINFLIKREQLAEYNLNSNQVAMICRAALEGIVPTKFRAGDNEYDIRVTIPHELKSDIKALENLPVVNQMQNLFLLSQVAKIERSYGPTTKERYNRKSSVTILGNISKPLGTVIKSLKSEIKKLNLPEDININLGGMGETMAEAFRDLFLALLLAVILVYLVMAAQFENWVEPFIIMGTLPLSIIGILTGLFLTGKTINIFSLMGIIVLVGIVVSNGILIINFAKNLIGSGKKIEEAIIEASTLRLRPILMTSISTLVGMTPLALAVGKGSAF